MGIRFFFLQFVFLLHETVFVYNAPRQEEKIRKEVQQKSAADLLGGGFERLRFQWIMDHPVNHPFCCVGFRSALTFTLMV